MKRACTIVLLLLLIGGAVAGWRWLERHPQHNPYAPFSLAHPIGWATTDKLTALVASHNQCLAIMYEANVAGASIEIGSGIGECRLSSTFQLFPETMKLRPSQPLSTCAAAAGLVLWQRKVVEPAAEKHFGQRVVSFEHMGTVNCRRIAGTNRMSEHASGNAYDISAFRLSGGRRISLIDGWTGKADEQAFLREIRDGACDIFATTLSPDFNTAHRDHFHFDMAARDFGAVCR